MDPTGISVLIAIIAGLWIISLYSEIKDAKKRYDRLNHRIDEFMIEKLNSSKHLSSYLGPLVDSSEEYVCFDGRTEYHFDKTILNKNIDKIEKYQEVAGYYAFISYFLYLALEDAIDLADQKELQKRYIRLDHDFGIKSSLKGKSALYNEVIGDFEPLTHDYMHGCSNKDVMKVYGDFKDYIRLDIKNQEEYLTDKEQDRYDELEKKYYDYLV